MKTRVAAALALILCCALGAPGLSLAGASVGAGVGAPPTSTSATPDQDIRDIHGPIAGPGPRHPGWYVGAAAAVLLAAAAVAYARRRKPLAPPHERALRALAELRSSPADDARLFSFTVSEVVRVYVEEAFQVRAAHRTTEELLVDLMVDTSPIAAHRLAVGEFLRHCDLAKFGGWALSRADMAALLASAETLVAATAPAPTRRNVPRAALRGEGVA